MNKILIAAILVLGCSAVKAEDCTLINTYTSASGQNRAVYTCTGVKNYYQLDEPITWWDQVLSYFGL